jgi:hypothetical protein
MIRRFWAWVENITARFKRAGGKIESPISLKACVCIVVSLYLLSRFARLDPKKYKEYTGAGKLLLAMGQCSRDVEWLTFVERFVAGFITFGILRNHSET